MYFMVFYAFQASYIYIYIYIYNTKINICSSDGDTDNFDIVAGMMQRETH